jgi:hypothetical protein
MTSLSENTVVTTSGGLVELAYKEQTSGLYVTATGSSRQTVHGPITVVCDGSPIELEIFFAGARPDTSAANRQLLIALFEDGVETINQFGLIITPTSGDVFRPTSIVKRLTPSAGVHTYEVKAYVDAGTGYIESNFNSGGIKRTASYIRASKIIQASQFIVPLASAPLVTSLPSTGNIDGQEVRYLIDDTSGTMWNLRWRASANRWEPISGFENDRNRIINGAMLIDQRRSNVVANSQTDVFVADRFRFYASGGGNANVQCVTNDGPTGVSTNSAKITVATQDTSLAAGDYYFIRQNIEGYNVQDLGFGTSANKIVTLSFYVKSSVTGTFGGSFKNDASNRSYTFSYTINAANTWERKIVTFTADNTGTWEKTTTGGLIINWSLGHGSSFTTSNINTWESANYNQPSGSTNLMATAAAAWQLSGVQLELGPTATPFQTRSFEEELRKSQRYFYKTPSTIMSNYVFFNSGNVSTTSMPFPVRMRANPIITYYDASGNINKVSFFVANGSNSDNNNPPAAYSATTDFWRFSAGGALSYTSPYTGHLYVSYEASAEIS